jgi:SAM-dependent methyltransferase
MVIRSSVRRFARVTAGTVGRFLPIDLALQAGFSGVAFLARLAMIRDWTLQARGRPQFFKHRVNIARWHHEPRRWSFAARGVYAREVMRRGARVLDLCCGDGSYSHLFFSDVASRVDAVDLDGHAISYARRNYRNPAISFRQMDILADELPSKDYDVVVWNAAICYFTIPEIDTVLRKVIAVSCHDMKLVGMLPRANGWVDHKTEFADAGSVESLLSRYFAEVAVRELDEGATTTYYFRASTPLPEMRNPE